MRAHEVEAKKKDSVLVKATEEFLKPDTKEYEPLYRILKM